VDSGDRREGGALRIVVGTDVRAFEQRLADGRLADAIALRTASCLPASTTTPTKHGRLAVVRARALRVAWRGAVLARLVRTSTPRRHRPVGRLLAVGRPRRGRRCVRTCRGSRSGASRRAAR
jgi:hypothetical protein